MRHLLLLRLQKLSLKAEMEAKEVEATAQKKDNMLPSDPEEALSEERKTADARAKVLRIEFVERDD